MRHSLIIRTLLFHTLVQLINNHYQILTLFLNHNISRIMAPNKSQQTAEAGDPKRKVLAHYFNLQASLRLIDRAASHNGQYGEDFTGTAAEAHSDMNGIGEFLSSQIEPIYYNERRQPNSTIATRVLQIPELLEMILEDTEFLDVLHMSETCHGIRNVIYASNKLQVKLFLKPAGQGESVQSEFSSLLVKDKDRTYSFGGLLVGFSICEPMDPYYGFDEEERILYIGFKKIKTEGNGRRIDANWNDMLICQPLIKEMEVDPECSCFASEGDESQCNSISSETGLTLGDLLKRAKTEMKKSCLWYKLADAEDQLYDGWEYEMSPSEAEEEIYTRTFESVAFRATIPPS